MTEVDQVTVESTAKELNKAMSALETSNDEESSTKKLINKIGKLNPQCHRSSRKWKFERFCCTCSSFLLILRAKSLST